ncbi:hypothetical protein ACWGIB_05880 [Streptomyces xiamenensis]
MHTNHAAKNAARARSLETGQPYAAALADQRTERLAHKDRLTTEDYVPQGAIGPEDALPTELLLVRYHVDTINKYFHEVFDQGRYQRHYREWTRLVLYRLTDSLEHFHLMVGTIAAHMQHNHIRSYLQVPDQRHVEQLISRRVREPPRRPARQGRRPRQGRGLPQRGPVHRPA